MKKLLALFASIIFISCSNSGNDPDKGRIELTKSLNTWSAYFNDGIFYDSRIIKVNSSHEDAIIEPSIINGQPGYKLLLFNYGQELTFSYSVRPEVYADSYGEYNFNFIVQKEDVNIEEVHESPNYGTWATGHVNNIGSDLWRYSYNVFISPLAMKVLNEEDNDNCLVLAMYFNPSDNLYKVGLFAGNYLTEYIISNHSSMVQSKSLVWYTPDKSWPKMDPSKE